MHRGFRVGEWSVYPLTGDISSTRGTEHLEPKVMEVLMALAERAEQVVLRDILLDRVWGARAEVSDEPLTRCIAQLRRALDDSPRAPRYIQTVPKRGYRLIQPVSPLEATTPESPFSHARPERASQRFRPRQSLNPASWRRVAASIGILAALGLASLGWNISGPAIGTDAVTATGRPASASAFTTEAASLVNRARERIAERRPEALHTAIEWLEDAIEIDDRYGPAYVEIARAYALLPSYSVQDDADQAYSRAYEWLIEGFQKNPSIRDATHGILAYLYFDRWEWIRAEEEFREALEETPDDADLLQWYAHFLAAVGHSSAAADTARRAWDLDPSQPVISDRLAVSLLWIDEDEAARAQFAAASARFTGVGPNSDSLIVHFIRDRNWRAVEELLIMQATQVVGSRAWIDPLIAHLEQPDDDSILEEAVAAFTRAVADGHVSGKYEFGGWVYLGQADRALEKALAMTQDPSERQALDTEWLFARETAYLRQDPRFEELLGGLGLSSYWDRSALGWPERCERSSGAVICD